MKEEIFIVGKVKLNDNNSPCIEIVLDTASGRSEGEIVLLKQISNQDNDYFTRVIPFDFEIEEYKKMKKVNKRGIVRK